MEMAVLLCNVSKKIEKMVNKKALLTDFDSEFISRFFPWKVWSAYISWYLGAPETSISRYRLFFLRSPILSSINPKFQLLILSDLWRLTQIDLTFKTQVLQVLNVRTICVNVTKSVFIFFDKIHTLIWKRITCRSTGICFLLLFNVGGKICILRLFNMLSNFGKPVGLPGLLMTAALNYSMMSLVGLKDWK